MLPLAAEYGVNILPADSEHSAIFQVIQVRALHGQDQEHVAVLDAWERASQLHVADAAGSGKQAQQHSEIEAGLLSSEDLP